MNSDIRNIRDINERWIKEGLTQEQIDIRLYTNFLEIVAKARRKQQRKAKINLFLKRLLKKLF